MRISRSVALLPVLVVALTTPVACLDRPVSNERPTTKAATLISSRQGGIDKIDLLFMIDNSASMADKQDILAEAVPDLITSLVTPSCVDDAGKPNGTRADPSAPEGKECSAGTPEFRPITDIHIGIVSSSMGGFGGSYCKDPERPYERDGARLVARGPGGARLAGVGDSNFLAWLPDLPRNATAPRLAGAPPITDLEALKRTASDLVKGVGDTGCGLEAQLESVYHFLNEPNPYTEVEVDGNNRASLVGLDEVLLRQRADFLRPDSLVAVVTLTDEDDSQVNPLAAERLGHFWANENALYSDVPRASPATGTTASRGTAACTLTPSSPLCMPCIAPAAKGDPGCVENHGFHAPDDDDINVRFHKMKSRFGLDPQYPIARYVDGLKSLTLPNRDGTQKCDNPLFARSLPRDVTDPNDPRLCKLGRGPRRPEQVFFAILGGVPGDLLHFDANDREKSQLSDADWDKLVGRDEDHYTLDEGVDPRMVQSTKPRLGRPGKSDKPGDNFQGSELRDWDTKNKDLQFACTFPLKKERDCSSGKGCDCNNSERPGTNPPLCGPSGKTQQFAKAYPTPRELRVARSLGKQGIASTLCPTSLEPVTKEGAPNPYYGYRPAVSTIVDRLKGVMTECLPQRLTRDPSGQVLCVALHAIPEKGASCSDSPGLVPAAPEVAASLLRRKHEAGDTSYDGKTLCQAQQIPVSNGETCLKSDAPGFCYVENVGDKRPLRDCSQAIVFSTKGTPRAGVTTDLLCIEQSQLGE